MTNFEKWREYMNWCVSPDCYIDFSFYNMIAASLQRRVWGGPRHSPLFANHYTILVGEPGVGKGLPIKEVTKIIKHHKLEDPRAKRNETTTKIDNVSEKANEVLQKEQYREAQEKEDSLAKKTKWFEQPLLIPVAADATTYQALIMEMASSKRLIAHPLAEKGIYTHSSLCFCLEEISSLFRKKMEDLIHFLIQAYDCGDYNYETINRGKDRVRNCCLNMLGGTTPGFMQSMFNDSMISEGFSSRSFFIFATKNRKTALRIPELTDEQVQYKKDIIEHVLKLNKLYGPVTYAPETWEYLEDWWKQSQHERPNISSKLNPYYARKNIHVQKLAMCLHFAETTEMTIPIETFQKALTILAAEEKKMHLCLGLDNANPLASATRKIEQFITRNGNAFSFKELRAEFWSILPGRDAKEDLTTILDHLLFVGTVESKMQENPRTGEMLMYYFGKKKSEL